MTSPSSAYSFLQGGGYLNGQESALSSLFSWMGGIMPPGGTSSNTQASADVEAWVAAGEIEN